VTTRRPTPYNTTAYRYPRERLILALTLLLVALVIALTATATVCLSVIFVAAAVALSYAATRAHHRGLLDRAWPVTSRRAPRLAALVDESALKLQAEAVDVFVVPGRRVNAYTFGLIPPKVLVLHAGLLERMDEDELRFVVGHELGHVRLGHTRLNSLVGGLAGIPSPSTSSVLLAMAFLWWNRACEYSADRAGLLVCGRPEKAASALIKLAAGEDATDPRALERALQRVEAEDDYAIGHVLEALNTHPMIARRIDALREYAASPQYRRLQPLIAGNVPQKPGRSPFVD
jgi:Zn-dependent protease with chaperone function